jgi:hypothetical protein
MRRWVPIAASLAVLLANACASHESDDGGSSDEAAIVASVADETRVEALGDVCPASRTDELCNALRSADGAALDAAPAAYEAAARLISARVASESRESVLQDRAVHYYVRERSAALFVWNHVTSFGSDSNGEANVDAALREFYPAYDPASFRLAHLRFPPKAPACARREAIVFAPGLFRALMQSEMSEAFAGLAKAFPCVDLVRVDSAQAGAPSDSAERLHAAVSELPPDEPVHLLGHSAGSASVLYALANHPDLGARTQTVVSLQPVAHGTDVLTVS